MPPDRFRAGRFSQPSHRSAFLEAVPRPLRPRMSYGKNENLRRQRLERDRSMLILQGYFAVEPDVSTTFVEKKNHSNSPALLSSATFESPLYILAKDCKSRKLPLSKDSGAHPGMTRYGQRKIHPISNFQEQRDQRLHTHVQPLDLANALLLCCWC